MGHILTVYSQSAYKDYLLPAVIDADYSLALSKEMFGLHENIELKLENQRGAWRFVEGGTVPVAYTSSGRPAFDNPILNGDIFSLSPKSGEQIAIFAKVTENFFRAFNKFALKGVNRFTIGKSPENTISVDENAVSATHAIMIRNGNEWIIEDHSKNGLFINSKRVRQQKVLEYGDVINIFGLSVVYLGDMIALDASLKTVRVNTSVLYSCDVFSAALPSVVESGTVLFHSAPRYLPRLSTDTVKIEPPPEKKQDEGESVLTAIGPSLTMAIPMLIGTGMAIIASQAEGGTASLFLYSGLVTAVASAIIGAIWALVSIRQSRKKLREDELKRFEIYGEYLISCANKVQEKYKRNSELMREMYPDSSACSQYNKSTPELWNKNMTHEDFLQHRLGIGEVPFQVDIQIPEEKFTMVTDSLAEKSKMIKDNYSMLHNVPVCVDLGRKIIGVIGGDGRKGCYQILRDLVTQIAATTCYTNVKLAFIYNGQSSTSGNWAFAKWLPHVWSEDKHVRYVANNRQDASDVFYELAKVLRMRSEERHEGKFKPHYVIFVEDPQMLDGELISTFLLSGADLGVSVVLLAERYEDLPNECEYIVENSDTFKGIYEVTEAIDERGKVKFDDVAPEAVESFARRLCRIQVKEMESGGEIPSQITFFDMYGAKKLEDLDVINRWQKNRTYDNIKGLLGQKSGGADCYLDVHEKYHGPHGLVAGTTGSGKSETLQTYMLSLAVNYSPDDVGFFIIDYKGGGMANLFSDLPHMIGQISNLSGNQVRRAMISIKSENARRMREFNEHGVNNINSYTKLYKNGEAKQPIPHMFIIIDEFAELKREEPDFMKELISVAQVGRSLGVHLILATQKPSGTVDDNIWSNAKFRLCLRVQDRQDSMDMLHRPEAAYIIQAGRGYLQVGNDELFELFQSGWSGAEYDESSDSTDGDIALMLTLTGKAALVGSHQKINKLKQERKDWINTLIEVLDNTGVTKRELKECLSDGVKLGTLTETFFRSALALGVDFPYTDSDAKRVAEFIKIRAAVGDSSGDIADAVIKEAAERGKRLPELRKKTQLEAVVEYLNTLAKKNGYVHDLKLWLPVLPDAKTEETTLYLGDLSGYSQNTFSGGKWPKTGKLWELEALVGLCDDPVNQAQMPLVVDFANNGHHAIVGRGESGKSTFLVTLIYSLVNRYAPNLFNFYAIDFSSKMFSSFEGLAHCGGVAFENDLDKISKLFNMLNSILEERKIQLRGGNYRQYVQAEAAKTGSMASVTMPAILLVIDNYAAFTQKTNEVYEEYVMKLSKEGLSCGIFLAVTGMSIAPAEIPSRLAENFKTIICLEMNDQFAYADALRTIRIENPPEQNIKGRGITKVGDVFLEFQTALTLKAEDDYKRGEAIKEICGTLNAAWQGRPARQIPEIPSKPTWKEFSALDEVHAMWKASDFVPLGYNQKNASVYGVDLRDTYCYMISGKARTGKTNALRVLLASACNMPGDVVLIDFNGEFTGMVKDTKVQHITTDKGLYDFLMGFQDGFIERNKYKWECIGSGDTDDELYDRMAKYRKMYLLVADLEDFVNHAEHPRGETEEETETLSEITGFIATVLDKGAKHNIYWFACVNQDNIGILAGRAVYEAFAKQCRGIHFGGNVAAQRLFEFEYIKYNDQTKTLKPGIGLLPSQDENPGITQVVVPLYRR